MKKTGAPLHGTWSEPSGLGIMVQQKAHRALGSQIAAGASLYRRAVHLPRLVPSLKVDPTGEAAAVTEEICACLSRAASSERRRGQSGHWSYSLNRHIALLQALTAERASLATLRDPIADAGGREATEMERLQDRNRVFERN